MSECPHCDGTATIKYGYLRGAVCSCGAIVYEIDIRYKWSVLHPHWFRSQDLAETIAFAKDLALADNVKECRVVEHPTGEIKWDMEDNQ